MNCFKKRNSRKKIIQESIRKYSSCIICFSDFNKNDKIKILKCGHIYHKECINEWFKKKELCPICR